MNLKTAVVTSPNTIQLIYYNTPSSFHSNNIVKYLFPIHRYMSRKR